MFEGQGRNESVRPLRVVRIQIGLAGDAVAREGRRLQSTLPHTEIRRLTTAEPAELGADQEQNGQGEQAVQQCFEQTHAGEPG
ncbi:hypothetical protein D9M68_969130 [compost metagenome]